jgi:hypothetical protein
VPVTQWFAAFDADGTPLALYRLDDRGGWRLDPATGGWEPSDTPGRVAILGSDRADQISADKAAAIARDLGCVI